MGNEAHGLYISFVSTMICENIFQFYFQIYFRMKLYIQNHFYETVNGNECKPHRNSFSFIRLVNVISYKLLISKCISYYHHMMLQTYCTLASHRNSSFLKSFQNYICAFEYLESFLHLLMRFISPVYIKSNFRMTWNYPCLSI